MTKKSRQTLKYLEIGKSFWGKIKSTFHQGLLSAENCLRLESAPLKLFQSFKNEISRKGILFFQETHSSKVTEKYGMVNLMTTGFFHLGNEFLQSFSWFLWQYQLFFEENSGRILVLDVAIEGTEYLLIYLYNGNTEPEQPKTLESLS